MLQWKKCVSGVAAATAAVSMLVMPVSAASSLNAAKIDATNRTILDYPYFNAVDYIMGYNNRLLHHGPSMMLEAEGEYTDEALQNLMPSSQEKPDMLVRYDSYDAWGNVVQATSCDSDDWNDLSTTYGTYDDHGYGQSQDEEAVPNVYNAAGQLTDMWYSGDFYHEVILYDDAGRVSEVDGYRDGTKHDVYQYTYEGDRLVGVDFHEIGGTHSLEKSALSYDDQGRVNYIITVNGGEGEYFTDSPNTYRVTYNEDGTLHTIYNAFHYSENRYYGYKYTFAY